MFYPTLNVRGRREGGRRKRGRMKKLRSRRKRRRSREDMLVSSPRG